MSFFVYIMASGRNGTLYVGQTENPPRRVNEHKTYAFPKSFTAVYHVTKLMRLEEYETRAEAKTREAKLKKYSRERKLALIESENPNWQDLAADWVF